MNIGGLYVSQTVFLLINISKKACMVPRFQLRRSQSLQSVTGQGRAGESCTDGSIINGDSPVTYSPQCHLSQLCTNFIKRHSGTQQTESIGHIHVLKVHAPCALPFPGNGTASELPFPWQPLPIVIAMEKLAK